MTDPVKAWNAHVDACRAQNAAMQAEVDARGMLRMSLVERPGTNVDALTAQWLAALEAWGRAWIEQERTYGLYLAAHHTTGH